jgi:hypothetical protein
MEEFAKAQRNSSSSQQPKAADPSPKETLGEYIDFEDIK